jgi:starvation-inducible DNA-binding protein
MASNGSVKRQHFATLVDLPAETLTQAVELLNDHLADVIDLASHVKQAHWNVKGNDFYALHLLFDEIAGELSEFVDEIAERATALGGYALGTVRLAAERSNLPEYPADACDGLEHVLALVERFGCYSSRARAAIDTALGLGDQATADLFAQLSRAVDKRLWFLEAHLQRPN